MMLDMAGVMWGMGGVWLIVIVVLALAAAAPHCVVPFLPLARPPLDRVLTVFLREGWWRRCAGSFENRPIDADSRWNRENSESAKFLFGFKSANL